VTPCHADIVGADADVDMLEIGVENEQKLQAMSEVEILSKQKELLSALGKLSHLTLLDLIISNVLFKDSLFLLFLCYSDSHKTRMSFLQTGFCFSS